MQTNLDTCLRMIDCAAQKSVELMVLPEFSNHISWYDGAQHATEVSLDLDGSFLHAIAQRARRHACHIIINVSLRRERGLTVSSILYGPGGERLAVADKQTLMGHENTWFQRATQVSPVVETEVGRLGIFPCRDGVTFETPRGLALRGAQLFCDSLNSFALDEASLHVPARAPENKVFLVAANKVGPLIPEHLLDAVSEQTHIPLRFLNGAGESQVVAPDGRILARGPREGEAVVWADIDLAEADDKCRPDGTDLLAVRRPALYRPIAEPPEPLPTGSVADTVRVATLDPSHGHGDPLDTVRGLIDTLHVDTRLAVLPELFSYEADPARDLDAAIERGRQTLATLTAACIERPELLLATSIVIEHKGQPCHAAVLVDRSGLRHQQLQMHRFSAHRWTEPGVPVAPLQTPWGRVALLCGDDACLPETAKLAALAGADVLAIPLRVREAWETSFGLPSRAAENRVCVVASAASGDVGLGLIATLEREFTIMTKWQERQFDGFINQPQLMPQSRDCPVTEGVIHPAAARNKLMSEATDLLLDRPWRLSGPLLEAAVSQPRGAVIADRADAHA